MVSQFYLFCDILFKRILIIGLEHVGYFMS